MQRLTVALLAALDAAIAAAVGLAVLLAPLTLLWTIAFGAAADWGALWPASGTLWQFGHGAAMQITIPDEVVRSTGIAPEAARFTLSVTPLALLLFTLLFAARSGRRASAAGAWLSGVIGGTAVFAAISLLVALTAAVPAARIPFWVGAVLPVAVYLAGALAGAVRHAWSEGDGGVIDRLHDVVDDWGDWAPVPAEAVRGAAVTLVALTGVGALGLAVMMVLRGGEVIALFESAHVDGLGATVITLGQLAYLPTLVVWSVAWIAGPGFAVGAGTAVSPAGTQLGVVPGIPVLGLLPPVDSFWTLVVVLIPIAAGALAGWMVRSKLVWEGGAEGYGPRAVIAAGIALLSAGVAALAAVLASGSIGPGRLAETGPQPGALALAIGLEVLVGAGILLLAPRHRDELAEERTDRWREEMAAFDAAPADARSSGQDTPGTRVD
ncbi:DUF6350 family protein [Microbacterium bovistercoris]|uniref:cell division protein PerM n=1 Tax=Microbacterium bovistercoris TaxID=2293570 RepID=UPI0015F26EAC|nr:DUF6350 family protein [Microbacterium bovistercoris]